MIGLGVRRGGLAREVSVTATAGGGTTGGIVGGTGEVPARFHWYPPVPASQANPPATTPGSGGREGGGSGIGCCDSGSGCGAASSRGGRCGLPSSDGRSRSSGSPLGLGTNRLGVRVGTPTAAVGPARRSTLAGHPSEHGPMEPKIERQPARTIRPRGVRLRIGDPARQALVAEAGGVGEAKATRRDVDVQPFAATDRQPEIDPADLQPFGFVVRMRQPVVARLRNV